MFQLIFKEIAHRKLNFLISLLAIVTAVALFVSFFTTGQASRRETIRLMRDIGFNLRIIPRETDMNKFLATGMSEYTMPEEYVRRFETQKNIYYNHLTAILHKRMVWNDMEIILTGMAPEEVAPPGKKKSPMIFVVKPGTVHVGSALADSLGIAVDDKIELLGRTFIVAGILSETGVIDDIRIYAHLRDVQILLGMEGKINEIKALECLCFGTEEDRISALRENLEELLPQAKVIEIKSIASARKKQRVMAEKYFAFIVPFALVVCAAWIGVLAMMNVRERRNEIGIMRAIGYGSGKIAVLFLGKAIVIGIIGAAIGFGVGTWLASAFGADIFKVTAKMIKPAYDMLIWSIIAAPAFAAVSSFIPAMIAVAQDPAFTLREE